MPLEGLVAERGDDVGLEGAGGGTAAQLVVGLGGGGHLVLRLAGASGCSERVVAQAGEVGALASGALLDDHHAAALGGAPRVRRVAAAHDRVLITPPTVR